MTILSKLDELKAIADAATRAPWIAKWAGLKNTTLHKLFWKMDSLKKEYPFESCVLLEGDAKFIANARTAMPQLIKALLFAREQFGLMAEAVRRSSKYGISLDAQFKRIRRSYKKCLHGDEK